MTKIWCNKKTQTMYFPEDVWRIVKSYQGFEKYYFKPSNKFYNMNTEFTIFIHQKSMEKLHEITQPSAKPISLIILQLFLFLINQNTWIQVLRKHYSIWDKITACIATECNSYLEFIFCGCGSEHCPSCTTYGFLDRISRVFYTMYLRE